MCPAPFFISNVNKKATFRQGSKGGTHIEVFRDRLYFRDILRSY